MKIDETMSEVRRTALDTGSLICEEVDEIERPSEPLLQRWCRFGFALFSFLAERLLAGRGPQPVPLGHWGEKSRGMAQTGGQDGRDHQELDSSPISSSLGKTQVSPPLWVQKAQSSWTQRPLKRTHRGGARDETAQSVLRLPQDRRTAL